MQTAALINSPNFGTGPRGIEFKSLGPPWPIFAEREMAEWRMSWTSSSFVVAWRSYSRKSCTVHSIMSMAGVVVSMHNVKDEVARAKQYFSPAGLYMPLCAVSLFVSLLL